MLMLIFYANYYFMYGIMKKKSKLAELGSLNKSPLCVQNDILF